ncbi:hypothetical protein [Archaeoglobus veneficus]|uniref:tRNA-binding domain-containing protein n=1 Tax=Archaeoglobus veneficus (strain DSM 11195 / SNP6) TaxID=693661 RepID=F2KR18_ARCVS|nr:hypothetical protein [Archaeoglobus veneficus]AEA47824.1 hypothetical protein Arcve_1828 [Archaeoglobus veneficus SNP6]
MKFEDIIELLRAKGYEVEYGLTISFDVSGETFKAFADAIAVVNGSRHILVKREEVARPLTPLERRTIAIARLFNVFGFAILTNEVEVSVLDVLNGKRVSIEEIPNADEVLLRQIDFDEEREKRIVAAIGSIRCSCCEDRCTI